jgi:hypothetical protein
VATFAPRATVSHRGREPLLTLFWRPSSGDERIGRTEPTFVATTRRRNCEPKTLRAALDEEPHGASHNLKRKTRIRRTTK